MTSFELFTVGLLLLCRRAPLRGAGLSSSWGFTPSRRLGVLPGFPLGVRHLRLDPSLDTCPPGFDCSLCVVHGFRCCFSLLLLHSSAAPFLSGVSPFARHFLVRPHGRSLTGIWHLHPLAALACVRLACILRHLVLVLLPGSFSCRSRGVALIFKRIYLSTLLFSHFRERLCLWLPTPGFIICVPGGFWLRLSAFFFVFCVVTLFFGVVPHSVFVLPLLFLSFFLSGILFFYCCLASYGFLFCIFGAVFGRELRPAPPPS